jgi:hypothetical protein
VGYFSNGSEGMDYEATYCDKCVHGAVHGDGTCQVWLLHLMHNYRDCNNDDSMLHQLIPRSKDGCDNEQCRMFVAAQQGEPKA